ncbi:MAG: NIL domain-containing protein [Planctomycetes bacterium]|nr:NIL domain-containing protein [Planctomycetota bacterium]MCB9935258.1 NIL domain-containing protein [Planctomycetota bacterium]
MAATIRKLTLSFPQKLIREPILHNISTRFGVMFNISRANVTEEQGFLELSLEGDTEALEKALEYLRSRGVTIEES